MHMQSLVQADLTVTTFNQKRRAAVILTGHSCALGADTHPSAVWSPLTIPEGHISFMAVWVLGY